MILVDLPQCFRICRVYRRYHRKVILEFEEVGLRSGKRVVQGVGQGWVIGSEGQFIDSVAKVEGCIAVSDVRDRIS